jgi:hypothetical protein
MDPVVYDWKLNYRGIEARFLRGAEALMPDGYYRRLAADAADSRGGKVGAGRNRELRAFALARGLKVRAGGGPGALASVVEWASGGAGCGRGREKEWLDRQEAEAERIRKSNGFDRVAHERNRRLLKAGKIGADRNRLPGSTDIRDVGPGDVMTVSNDLTDPAVAGYKRAGQELLREGAVACVTFAGGLGSRWADGAAIVKPINPFVMMKGKHRSFVEIHLAKSQDFAARYRTRIQHVFTTSYLTHEPLARELKEHRNFGYEGRVYLSQGHSIEQRVYPMERDLRFLWQGSAQQRLDEQAQKVRDAAQEALIQWAREHGEGEDYGENVAIQRFNPPGHFFEIPNMLRNGTLGRMLKDNPALKYLMAHNADTTGVFLSPILLGMHHASGKAVTYEVTPRRYEDKGGGLARIDGRPRIVEALALPREEDEYKLTYYNTLTNWLSIDRFLSLLGLSRGDVVAVADRPSARAKVDSCLHALEERVPTYVTIKEVKVLWGAGQEDIFPVAQFEKLWGDLTWLPEVECGFLAVERRRGQQLKDPSQLDRFVRDGSRDYVAGKCHFTR